MLKPTNKLYYASDIHLEFDQFPRHKEPHAIEKEVGTDHQDDYLMLAGDTVISIELNEKRTDAQARKLQSKFKRFCEHVQGFKKVVGIPGNHEAYQHGDVAFNCERINEFLYKNNFDNIRWVENERVPLTDHTDLLACTLWTDMGQNNPMAHQYVSRGMADFMYCDYNGQPFTTMDAYDKHKESIRFLSKELCNPQKDYIVATHHLPSWQLIDPYYKSSLINYGYASDLEDLIHCNPNIRAWICGHTHYNFPPITIGYTQMLSNMRGYPEGVDDRGNWKNFKLDKFFEFY